MIILFFSHVFIRMNIIKDKLDIYLHYQKILLIHVKT